MRTVAIKSYFTPLCHLLPHLLPVGLWVGLDCYLEANMVYTSMFSHYTNNRETSLMFTGIIQSPDQVSRFFIFNSYIKTQITMLSEAFLQQTE